MQIVLIIISFILAFALNVTPKDNVQLIVEMQLLVYISLIIANYMKTKCINLFQVWLVAFIFIIHSDILFTADSKNVMEYISPFFLYLMANNLVLVGYNIQNAIPQHRQLRKDIYTISNKHWYVFILFVFTLIFLLGSLSEVRNNLMSGRQLDEAVGSASVVGIFVNAVGILLPSLIAYFFRDVRGTKKWLQLIFVIPILVIHMILATRFKLLFALVPYCVVAGIIDVVNVSKKKLIPLIMSVLLVLQVASFMKANRYNTLAEMSVSNEYEDEIVGENARWSVKLAAQMSPEGIMKMSRYADKYFEHHELCYGRESAHLLFRWVPRAIWKNKPMPIDHWLIRYYENVSEYHSTSSGFIGIFRADFGWFALIFAILIGMLIRRLNDYMSNVCCYRSDSIELVIAAMIIPYVFFMVRSPITATYIFLYEYIVYMIVRILATNKK